MQKTTPKTAFFEVHFFHTTFYVFFKKVKKCENCEKLAFLFHFCHFRCPEGLMCVKTGVFQVCQVSHFFATSQKTPKVAIFDGFMEFRDLSNLVSQNVKSEFSVFSRFYNFCKKCKN